MNYQSSPLILKTLAASVLATLAGCAYGPHKESVDNRTVEIEKMIAEHQAPVSADPRSLVRYVKGSYIGGRSSALSDDDNLPAVFSDTVDYSLPGAVSLQTIASEITRISGIPVRLKADISNAPIQQQNTNVVNTMEIRGYRGPLTGLLNLVASRFNINWENQKDGVVFYRLVTKSFTVASVGTTRDFSAGLGKSSSGGAGAQGGFTSSGEVKVTGKSDLLQSLTKMIETIKTPEGRFSINMDSGILTVTDTRDVVEMVDKIMGQTNAIMSRQVAVQIKMYKLQRTTDRQIGFDWNVVFHKISQLNPQWRALQLSPTPLTSEAAGTLGVSIVTPVGPGDTASQKLSGSDLLLRALQGFGNINLVTSTSTITLNRRASPSAVTSEQGYLARVTPGTAGLGGIGGSPGLEPATVTTGFLTNVTPSIQDNNEILLDLTLDSSILRELTREASGIGANQQSIQTPAVDRVGTISSVALKSGASLVLTGYERENSQYAQRGITDRIETGGSYNGRSMKESVMIVVTPTIVGGLNVGGIK